MKKNMLTIAVAGTLAALSGTATAQSSVQIYGLVDTGYIKESGRDVRMGHNYESRIGFRGSEDLGSGLKATFELERRFNLNDGTGSTAGNIDDNIQSLVGTRNGSEWVGAANLGLASNNWGRIRFGRVNNLAVETFLRIDPFAYYSIGASTAVNNLLYAEQISNTARYDSPSWNGLRFGLGYSLGSDHHDSNLDQAYLRLAGNDGFNVMLMYDNGPLLLLGNFQRVTDSDNSYLWNVGGAYTYGPATVSLGYHHSYTKILSGLGLPNMKQRDWLLGLKWALGPGELQASFNYSQYEGTGSDLSGFYDGDAFKYALGYTYNLSKRTSVYGMVSYSDYDDRGIGSHYNSSGQYHDSVTGVQLGLQHRF